MAAIPVATATDGELAEALFAALDRAEEPLALTKLAERLPATLKKVKNRFEPILGELVAQRRLHHFAAFGRTKGPRFWTRDSSHYARELSIQVLQQKGPLTAAKLRAFLQGRVKDLTRDQLSRVLESLIQERLIRELPVLPGGRSKRLSLHPPLPREYLEKAFQSSVFRGLRKTLDLLAKEGVTPEQLLEETNVLWRETLAKIPAIASAAAVSVVKQIERSDERSQGTVTRRPTANDAIVNGILAIKPNAAEGAMVALPDLRRHMRDMFPTKAVFDTAVLQLAAAGRVDLHRHTFPANLDEQERTTLVTDGEGDFYMGIVLRS